MGRQMNAFVAAAALCVVGASATVQQWTPEKANAWYSGQGWRAGSNYIVRTAINQIEMFDAPTWNTTLSVIDQELGWAEAIGFNAMRVFLHNLPYKADPKGFLARVDDYLRVADSHGIRTVLVLLDCVWDPFPRMGKQRAPKPYVHNSGWVQAPGHDVWVDPSLWESEVGEYVRGVVGRFANDPRVYFWDLINEPLNGNYPSYQTYVPENYDSLTTDMLKLVFGWAREANPTQPLTAGVWMGDWDNNPVIRLQLGLSDVISFHAYSDVTSTKRNIDSLRKWNRPIINTEYMARPTGSTFDPVLGMFKQQGVAAFNWGFVNGKSQTIYPWDSWCRQYTSEPDPWFHDIFRSDGTPYRSAETVYIKKTMGK